MSDIARSSASPAKLLGYVTIAVGGAVLVGWFCDIFALKSVLPGFVTMKPNAAAAFMLAGLALALLGRDPPSAPARWMSQACAATVALLGLFTLCQYLFGFNFGIDQLLFHEPTGSVGTLSPGRMAPMTAINLLLLGYTLLLAGYRRAIPIAQRLALFTGLMGLVPLLGYLYGATALLGIGHYTQMAIPTAVLFIVLSLGVLLLRPADGIMRLMTGDTRGGWLLRRLTPFVVGIPMLLGWLRMWGERRGYFESALGTALMMMLLMLLSFIIIWWAAQTTTSDEIARKREEETLRRFATVVRDSNDAITIQDFAGNITAWNRGAELMYGYSEAEALVSNIDRLTTPGKVAEQQDFIRRLIEGEAVTSFETQRVTKDGRVLDVWMTVTKLLDDAGTPMGLASTERDITARKQADDALRESEEQFRVINKELSFQNDEKEKRAAELVVANKELSFQNDEKEKRAAELVIANKEIRKLNEELEERVKQRTAQLTATMKESEAFSYSVAHDLKAPLRAMSGFASILSEDYAPKLDDEGRRLIGVIKSNANIMGRLIDDLLLLSHLGRQSMKVAAIDMTELARGVCKDLQEAIPNERRIEITVKALPGARADYVLIKQVLINLVSNAIKFASGKDKAVIEIGGYDKGVERVYYVKDNGVGFDMKYADKLFGVFQRLHPQEEFSGTGIGLAIVSSAVHRHGGAVRAEAEVGKGATFYFTLP